MALLSEAIRWYQAGYMPVPLKPDGTKAPAVPRWTDYQRERPDLATVLELFAIDSDGIGLICGAVSGGLEMFELESRAYAEGYLERLELALKDHELGRIFDVLTAGYMEATPSGGLHFYYRVAGHAKRNTKLAQRIRDGKREPLIETRGEGGFTVIAPSAGRSHPTGRSWDVIAGTGPESIPVISEEDRDALYVIASTLDEIPVADPLPRPTGDSPTPNGLRPGDDFNIKANWADILEGWKVYRRYSGNLTGWQRPGKTHPGLSATTGRNEADRLYVFSTATEFEAEKPYSKFAAFSLLNYGGDFAAAARELRRQGYGDQSTSHANDWDGLWEPPSAEDGDKQGENTERSSWRPVDLTSVLDGSWQPPQPSVGRRTDGQGLFYPGKTHTVVSETEAGKTWLALAASIHEMEAGCHVFYVDFEDDEGSVVGRLLTLGVNPEVIAELFHYIRPEEPLNGRHLEVLREALDTYRLTLVILDGITEAMTLHGLKPTDNTDIALFDRTVIKPLTDSGAAEVSFDHVTKDREARGRYAIGGVHKLNIVTGGGYTLENRQPFGIGVTGRSTIKIAKDRPAQLRRNAVDKWYGDLVLASNADGTAEVWIESSQQRVADREAEPPFRPTNLMEKISRYIEDGGQADSQNDILKGVPGNAKGKIAALKILKEEGYVTPTKPFSSLKPYRQSDEK